MTREGFVLGHNRSLDGFRGLAILLVISFNWKWGVRAGYIGVDLFFVLSGFLITSLLIAERRGTERIDLPAFFLRRALRLLPALLLLLASLLVMSSGARQNYLGLLAVLFYVGNWVLAFGEHGYSLLSGLAHTWSLSVEEQFYLLWPPLAASLLGRGVGLRGLAILASGGALASFLWKIALSLRGASPLRIYAATETRADALLIGCLLALVLHIDGESRGRGWRVPPLLAWLALVAIVCGGLSLPLDSSPMMQRGGFTLTALTGAILLAHLVQAPAGLLGRGFAFEPLVWTGRVSYGLYLWHPLVGSFVTADRTGLSSVALVLAKLTSLIGVTAFSWLVVERPALRLKDRFSRRVEPRV